MQTRQPGLVLVICEVKWLPNFVCQWYWLRASHTAERRRDPMFVTCKWKDAFYICYLGFFRRKKKQENASLLHYSTATMIFSLDCCIVNSTARVQSIFRQKGFSKRSANVQCHVIASKDISGVYIFHRVNKSSLVFLSELSDSPRFKALGPKTIGSYIFKNTSLVFLLFI